MTINDVLLGFGVTAVVLLSIPAMAIGIGMNDPDEMYRRAAWQSGAPFIIALAIGWLCLAVWGVLAVL